MTCWVATQMLWLLLLRAAVCQTDPSDVEALSALKAGFQPSTFLDNWVGDPCGTDDGSTWPGIICDCQNQSDIEYTWPALEHVSAESCIGAKGPRVLYLDLGITELGRIPLEGTISPAIGNLSAVQLLNFQNNGPGLIGEVPDTIAGMPNLKTILLGNNALTGELPNWLGEMESLVFVTLINNRFSGPIPLEWCKLPQVVRLDVSENPGLCGAVPPCTYMTVASYTDTELFPPFEANTSGTSFQDEGPPWRNLTEYCCEEGRPVCEAERGCGVQVPRYWSEEGVISFNFTMFEDEYAAQAYSDPLERALQLYEFWLSPTAIIPDLNEHWLNFSLAPQYSLVLHSNVSITEDSTPRQGTTFPEVLEYVGNFSKPVPPGNASELAPALLPGDKFSVLVRARSQVCPHTYAANLSKSMAQAASEAPNPGNVLQLDDISGDDSIALRTQWDPFRDDVLGFLLPWTSPCNETQACYYSWQLLHRGPLEDTEWRNATEPIKVVMADTCDDVHSCDVFNKTTFLFTYEYSDPNVLQWGWQYKVQLHAVNAAGVEGSAGTISMAVPVPDEGGGTHLYMWLGLASGFCLLLLIALAFVLLAWRRNALLKELSAREERMQALWDCMAMWAPTPPSADASGGKAPSNKLTKLGSAAFGTSFAKLTHAHDGPLNPSDPSLHGSGGGSHHSQGGSGNLLQGMRELAVVITDLQDSTPMAAADEGGYHLVQQLHDDVLRENLQRFGGYEINTEGDSFHIAFPTVVAAVGFCCACQYQLLRAQWPSRVLKMPSCKKVTHEGELVFNGPRVRMGVHWATKGTIGARQHQLTRHWVFSGPGFMIAQEVGDAGAGGQIVLTQWAWQQLRGNMAAAGHPAVCQLGLFKLQSWTQPVWLYEVQQQLGRPLFRSFPPLRGVQQLAAGYGFNVMPPPEVPPAPAAPRLTFVALALDTSVMAVPLSAVPWLPPQLATVLAVMAQQTGGYLNHANHTHLRYMVAFASTRDALRFCFALQVALLYEQWPRDVVEQLGITEKGLDGTLIFRGPRLATAMVESEDFTVRVVQQQQHPSGGDAWVDVTYCGRGPRLASELAQRAHGGQVVLDEEAWRAVKDTLQGTSQALSLGTHVVGGAFQEPLLLMEATHVVLQRRSFPPLRSAACLSPGYRDSPDPAHDVAIVFVNTVKPAEVAAATHMDGAMSDERMLATLTAYLQGVTAVGATLRRLLREHNGYECKEPAPGKFTLAFSDLGAALRCCTTLQLELTQLPWPEEVLEWEESREQRVGDDNGDGKRGGELLWHGLRVRVGIAYGHADHRKPLTTGRADYYGSLPNLAARVCSLAAPGQVLVEAHGLEVFPAVPLAHVREDSLAHASGDTSAVCRYLGPWPAQRSTVVIEPVGALKLKGFDDERWLFKAALPPLMARPGPQRVAQTAAKPVGVGDAGVREASTMLMDGWGLAAASANASASASVRRQQRADGGSVPDFAMWSFLTPLGVKAIRRKGGGGGGGGASRLGPKQRSWVVPEGQSDDNLLAHVTTRSLSASLPTAGAASLSAAGVMWTVKSSPLLPRAVAADSAAAGAGPPQALPRSSRGGAGAGVLQRSSSLERGASLSGSARTTSSQLRRAWSLSSLQDAAAGEQPAAAHDARMPLSGSAARQPRPQARQPSASVQGAVAQQPPPPTVARQQGGAGQSAGVVASAFSLDNSSLVQGLQATARTFVRSRALSGISSVHRHAASHTGRRQDASGSGSSSSSAGPARRDAYADASAPLPCDDPAAAAAVKPTASSPAAVAAAAGPLAAPPAPCGDGTPAAGVARPAHGSGSAAGGHAARAAHERAAQHLGGSASDSGQQAPRGYSSGLETDEDLESFYHHPRCASGSSASGHVGVRGEGDSFSSASLGRRQPQLKPKAACLPPGADAGQAEQKLLLRRRRMRSSFDKWRAKAALPTTTAAVAPASLYCTLPTSPTKPRNAGWMTEGGS